MKPISKARTRAEIESRVAACRATLDGARKDLTDARTAYLESERAYVDTGRRAALESKRDRNDELERCAALERRAVDAHEAALVELAAVDREDAVKKLEELTVVAKAHPGEGETLAGELARRDAEIDAVVLRIARAASSATAAYDQSVTLGDQLRIPGFVERVGPRPSLAGAALACRRFVAAARAKGQRENVACVFLSDPPDLNDWTLRGADVEEIRQRDLGVQMAQTAAAQRREVETFLAGVSAAPALAKPAATTTETSTTENTNV